MKKLLLLSLFYLVASFTSVAAMDLAYSLSGVWIDETNNIEMLNKSLLNAVKRGDLESVQILLSNPNIDVNTRNKYDETALHLIVQYKPIEHLENEFKYDDEEQEKITTALIQAGADLNIQDKDGNTPLHIAILNEYTDIAELLIEAGADLNLRDKDGDTALHLASKQGYTEIVKLLIIAGANLNIQNRLGNTALHVGAINGIHYEQIKNIVELLIKAGANIRALNLDNKKPSTISTNYIIRAILQATEKNVITVEKSPFAEEEQLNQTLIDNHVELTVPKDAYFKMMYHNVPYKMELNDSTYFLDLCKIYDHFIKGNKVDELIVLFKYHGLTNEQLQKLGSFFPSEDVIKQQKQWLSMRQKEQLTDFNFRGK